MHKRSRPLNGSKDYSAFVKHKQRPAEQQTFHMNSNQTFDHTFDMKTLEEEESKETA